MCGMNRAAGDCDAATGRCNCPAGSGLEAGFVPNPSVAARNITPEVPACNYQFVPTGTFKLSGMTASIAQLLADGTTRRAVVAISARKAAAALP
uniref:Uncharacterized protein n=1 Tax=Tetradesmus obliquus TaxID=3088 RepID=A0A383VBW2_TETOB|eukprot:jgi/Sobl393_1/6797/SZX62249.1